MIPKFAEKFGGTCSNQKHLLVEKLYEGSEVLPKIVLTDLATFDTRNGVLEAHTKSPSFLFNHRLQLRITHFQTAIGRR